MKIIRNARKSAAEQGVSKEGAITKGMEEESRDFTTKGSKLYAKARIRHNRTDADNHAQTF